MMAEPLLTAVTLPEEDTLATFVLEEDHFTVLSVMPFPDSEYFTVLVAPFFVRVNALVAMDTLVG